MSEMKHASYCEKPIDPEASCRCLDEDVEFLNPEPPAPAGIAEEARGLRDLGPEIGGRYLDEWRAFFRNTTPRDRHYERAVAGFDALVSAAFRRSEAASAKDDPTAKGQEDPKSWTPEEVCAVLHGDDCVCYEAQPTAKGWQQGAEAMRKIAAAAQCWMCAKDVPREDDEHVFSAPPTSRDGCTALAIWNAPIPEPK